MLNAIILNDTRRDDGHIGCSRVMSNIEHLCSTYGINVLQTVTQSKPTLSAQLEENLKKAHLVIINGEGSMHSDKPLVQAHLTLSKYIKQLGVPIFLINSIWHNNTKYSQDLSVFDSIYLRDKESFLAASKYHSKCHFVPDLSLYTTNGHMISSSCKEQQHILWNDSVLKGVTQKLLLIATRRKSPFYFMDNTSLKKAFRRFPLTNVQRKFMCQPSHILTMHDIQTASMIITGRYHATLMALLHGTAFVSIGSNTPKTEQFFLDAKLHNVTAIAPSEVNENNIDTAIKKALNFWTSAQRRTFNSFLYTTKKDAEAMFENIVKTAHYKYQNAN